MTPRQFATALAQHPKMQPDGAATQAARLVLVDGLTAYAAAQKLSIHQSGVGRAIARLMSPHCPSCRCFK